LVAADATEGTPVLISVMSNAVTVKKKIPRNHMMRRYIQALLYLLVKKG